MPFLSPTKPHTLLCVSWVWTGLLNVVHFSPHAASHPTALLWVHGHPTKPSCLGTWPPDQAQPYPCGAVRLVDHHPRMRQAVPHALGSGSQKKGSHAAGLPHTPRGDGRLDVTHGVVDPQTSTDRATWKEEKLVRLVDTTVAHKQSRGETGKTGGLHDHSQMEKRRNW